MTRSRIECLAAADALEGALHLLNDDESAERLAHLADQWRAEAENDDDDEHVWRPLGEHFYRAACAWALADGEPVEALVLDRFLVAAQDYAAPCRPAQPVDVAELARRFSLWLNGTYPDGLDPETLMRRRVLKVCEESGEVAEAVGAFWHENPRKPPGSLDDVIKELADCAGAALGAIEHLTGHYGESLRIVTQRVEEVCDRVGVLTDHAQTSERHVVGGAQAGEL